MRRRFKLLVVAASLGATPVVCCAQGDVLGDDETGGSEAAAGRSPAPASGAASGDAADAVSFEVGAGLEHDSNVTVLELDASTGAGDTAALLQR